MRCSATLVSRVPAGVWEPAGQEASSLTSGEVARLSEGLEEYRDDEPAPDRFTAAEIKSAGYLSWIMPMPDARRLMDQLLANLRSSRETP